MKYKTVQEKMTAIHYWISTQKKNVDVAREKALTPQQKIMLAGKAKAYVDCMCFIQDKYGKYLL